MDICGVTHRRSETPPPRPFHHNFHSPQKYGSPKHPLPHQAVQPWIKPKLPLGNRAAFVLDAMLPTVGTKTTAQQAGAELGSRL